MQASEFPGTIGRTIADSTPWWPPKFKRPPGRPNILLVLFDDVGFSDFGCYGSPIRTPTIDAIAQRGLRLTGFHTTAMCSTTRASLLTGCNHHSVGMGCLANFDSGFPGYKGKIAADAATLPEMLRPHGYVNYMVGKWHCTPLHETGPTGPFDGWPLGRGFDRYYGFMDAETDQYAPELVRDNSVITPPGTFESGYHLTADLVDQSIRFLADHVADRPNQPWHLWLAFGACHAPHQAPPDLIRGYDATFAQGYDVERDKRLAREIELGIVPSDTQMPPRNPGVEPWDRLQPPVQKLFTRLQSAYAAMLDHADQHLARLIAFLDATGQRDDTIVLVLSDNGASQEGGPFGMVNAMGPYNFKPEPPPEKIARIDDIGGPDTHSNFPWGWAMAANTPLKRYKQNTHGGGIRDPLVMSWPNGLKDEGALRHGFCHACDLTPTLLELAGLSAPASVRGVACRPMEGESFATNLREGGEIRRRRPQHFEMFGHRGLWSDGWKAVAYHAPGTPFDKDVWELYDLAHDFSEAKDLAEQQPEKLKALVDIWWTEAARCNVLPLDDRFGLRFAENGLRNLGDRTTFVLHHGMGHLPTDVAPDLRNRAYAIEADVRINSENDHGVLVSHGDATSGYSLYIKDGHLVHDTNIGGLHQIIVSDRPVTPGSHILGFRVAVGPLMSVPTPTGPVELPSKRTGMLTIDGEDVGTIEMKAGFANFVSWSGLDIGLDRSSPVSHYEAPFEFTGVLRKVTVRLGPMPQTNGEGLAAAEMARQ